MHWFQLLLQKSSGYKTYFYAILLGLLANFAPGVTNFISENPDASVTLIAIGIMFFRSITKSPVAGLADTRSEVARSPLIKELLRQLEPQTGTATTPTDVVIGDAASESTDLISLRHLAAPPPKKQAADGE